MAKTTDPRHWSEAHLALLRQHYPVTGTAVLADLIGRSPRAIVDKAFRLKVTAGRRGPTPAPKSLRPARRIGVKADKVTKPLPKPAKATAPKVAAPKPESRPSNPAKHRPLPGHGLKYMQVGASKPSAGSPIKQSPATPNANARVNARRRAEAGKATPIADLIKALPANSPGRALYTNTARVAGGPAADAALRTWLARQSA